MSLIGKGKKTLEWDQERKKLKEIYEILGITTCEWLYCNATEYLSFSHFEKRSSGKAEHTFLGTCLLCIPHHEIVEYNREANEMMRKRHYKLYAELYNQIKDKL
jgi:hypothetical protein